MNEVDKFFAELPSEDTRDSDIFKQDVAPTAPEKEKEPEDKKEVRKNRRERRLEERLEEKDDMLIALNERIIELSKPKDSQTNSSGDVPAEWIALYGESPEAKRAWQMQEQLLEKATIRAKEEALKEFEQRQNESVQEQKRFESVIDSELEALEEEHDVDLTSNSPAARKARREFLEMVQNLSPKDESGNISSYADFNSTFEVYQNMKVKEPETNTKQKELSARSMQKPAVQGVTPTQTTPGFRGWMKDFNL